LNKSWWT